MVANKPGRREPRRRLPRDEQFAKLRQDADKRRRREQLTVAMNYGIARDVIGEPPVELAAVLRRADLRRSSRRSRRRDRGVPVERVRF
jgi:hypothetical protein